MKFLIISENKFTRLDRDFLALIEENQIFEQAVKGIRKYIGLPQEGYISTITAEGKIKIVNFTESTTKTLDGVIEKIDTPIRDLMHAFSLPPFWWNTLYSIITLNIAVPPMRDAKWNKSVEIRFAGGLGMVSIAAAGLLEHPNQFEPHLEIVVREKMTLAKLIDALKSEKKELERYLNYLDSTPDTSHLKDIDIKKEILRLEKEGKSDLEIVDHLEEKYQNNLPFAPDHNTVNHYKQRFKKLIKKMPTNKYYIYYLRKYLE